MIPGEPLLHVQRPITPPGVVHPNPAHDVARTMLAVILWSTFAIWLFGWATADPMPDCVYEGRAHVMHRPSGLTERQVLEIQDLWRTRTTIATLAERYGITTDMVRKIIAMPREEE